MLEQEDGTNFRIFNLRHLQLPSMTLNRLWLIDAGPGAIYLQLHKADLYIHGSLTVTRVRFVLQWSNYSEMCCLLVQHPPRLIPILCFSHLLSNWLHMLSYFVLQFVRTTYFQQKVVLTTILLEPLISNMDIASGFCLKFSFRSCAKLHES